MAKLRSWRGNKITKTMCRQAGQKTLVRFLFVSEVAGDHPMSYIQKVFSVVNSMIHCKWSAD